MTDVRNAALAGGAGSVNLDVRRKLFPGQLQHVATSLRRPAHSHREPVNIGAKARPALKRPLLPPSSGQRPGEERAVSHTVKAIYHIAELWRQLRRQIQRNCPPGHKEIDDQLDRFHRALEHHCASFSPQVRRLFGDHVVSTAVSSASRAPLVPKHAATQVLVPGRNVVDVAYSPEVATAGSSGLPLNAQLKVAATMPSGRIGGGIKKAAVPGLKGSFTRDKDLTLMISLRQIDPNFGSKSVNVAGLSLRTEPVEPVYDKNKLMFFLDSNENFVNDKSTSKSKRRNETMPVSGAPGASNWSEVNHLMSDIVQAALPQEPTSLMRKPSSSKAAAQATFTQTEPPSCSASNKKSRATTQTGKTLHIASSRVDKVGGLLVDGLLVDEDSQKLVELVERRKHVESLSTFSPTARRSKPTVTGGETAASLSDSSSDVQVYTSREAIHSSKRGKRRHSSVEVVRRHSHTRRTANEEESSKDRISGSVSKHSSKRKGKKKKRKLDLPYIAGQRLSTWDPKERYKDVSTEETLPPSLLHDIPSGNEDELYEVDAIREMMKDQNGKEWFLIKWAGYSESQNTWEPLENVVGFGDHGQRIDFLRRLYQAKLECSKYIMNDENYEWKPQSVTDLDLILPMRQFNVSERQKRREGGSFYHEAQHWERPLVT